MLSKECRWSAGRGQLLVISIFYLAALCETVHVAQPQCGLYVPVPTIRRHGTREWTQVTQALAHMPAAPFKPVITYKEQRQPAARELLELHTGCLVVMQPAKLCARGISKDELTDMDIMPCGSTDKLFPH